MVILGRTYADGTDQDYDAVNAPASPVQDHAAGAFGKPFTYQAPPVNANPGFCMTDKPQAVILGMDTAAYFNMMAQTDGQGRSAGRSRCADAGQAWRRSASCPARRSTCTNSTPPCRRHSRIFRKQALKQIEANKNSFGQDGQWLGDHQGPRRYGTDYMKRAVVAAFGWPANLQDDAVYPYTEVDSKGEKLTGANRYTLTFAKDKTPPVDGFWSITMYMIDRAGGSCPTH